MPNLWGLLLDGLLYFLSIVVFPLFGGADGLHSAMGLGSKMLYNTKIIFEMLFLAVGNFDLTLIGISIGLTFPLWVIRIVLRIWLAIKALIPAA